MNGILSNPFQTTHDGTDGEIVEKKLFLKNDDAGLYYTNLTLQFLPLTKTGVGDINYPEAFVVSKIVVQDDQPTQNQWQAVASGNRVNFPDIGAAGSSDLNYKPFWVLRSIPAGTAIQNISDTYIHCEGESSPI